MTTSRRASATEVLAQAARLEPLGWKVEPTTMGGIIRSPDGGTVMVHRSGGNSSRTIANTAADLEAIGFTDALNELVRRKKVRAQATTKAARAKVDHRLPIVRPGVAAVFSSASTDDTARPSSTRGIVTRSEKIAPERAEELLARALSVTLDDGTQLHQRRIFEGEVAKFVKLIEAGQWIEDMPEGLSFTEDGSLINGRHRLTAQIRTGRTLGYRVHYNVPVKCFSAFDTGRTRTSADALTMAGYANAHQLNSALKLQSCLDMWLADPAGTLTWPQWHKIKLTNRDTYDAALRYPEMGQYVRDGQNVAHGSGLNAPAVAVFLHSAFRAWPEGRELITDFRIALHTGEDIRRGDPAYELREWVRRNRGDGRQHRGLHLMLLNKVFWTYLAKGKSLHGIPRNDDRQPMIGPMVPRSLPRQLRAVS